MLRGVSFVALCCSLQFHNTHNFAHAQYFTGTVAQAVGGAGRAGAERGEETLLNPAALAHAKLFASDVVYTDNGLTSGNGDQTIAVALVDNNEEAIFPGALHFVKKSKSFKGLGDVDETFWQFSAGNFIYEQWSFGLSVYNLSQEVGGAKDHSHWDGIMGFNYNPHPDLAMAIVFYNLIGSPETVPNHLRQLQKMAFGFNYIVTDFLRTRLDVGKSLQLNPESEWQIMGGFESFLGKFTILRFGWDSNPRENMENFTTGIGFNGPRLKFDYTFARNTYGEGGSLHSIDLRIPF